MKLGDGFRGPLTRPVALFLCCCGTGSLDGRRSRGRELFGNPHGLHTELLRRKSHFVHLEAHRGCEVADSAPGFRSHSSTNAYACWLRHWHQEAVPHAVVHLNEPPLPFVAPLRALMNRRENGKVWIGRDTISHLSDVISKTESSVVVNHRKQAFYSWICGSER